MAKKRFYFGKILKGGEGKPDFMVIDRDIVLKEGEFVNLESKKQRLEDLEKSVSEGKISEELASDLKRKVEKLSDRVRFSLYVVREK